MVGAQSLYAALRMLYVKLSAAEACVLLYDRTLVINAERRILSVWYMVYEGLSYTRFCSSQMPRFHTILSSHYSIIGVNILSLWHLIYDTLVAALDCQKVVGLAFSELVVRDLGGLNNWNLGFRFM